MIVHKHIGFTGTQRGMSQDQKRVVKTLMADASEAIVHHGDCVGADSDFHDIVFAENSIELHPCDITAKRAWCIGDVCHFPKAPLVRNKDIVNVSELLIACPGEKHMKIRSGTWSTVRYAQEMGKPVFLVFPDGTTARM